MPGTRSRQLWRNSSMNRKTLVLAAVVGLLAPVLAGCGDTDGGSGDSDAIVVGTTDRFTASEDDPAPIDPPSAYDVGTWNVLRQTVQTLMIQPRGAGEPVPWGAGSGSFAAAGNGRSRCVRRRGLTSANGAPAAAEAVQHSVDRALAIKGDGEVSALLSTFDPVEPQGDREV